MTDEMQQKMLDNRCCSACDSASSAVRFYAVSDGMGGHNAGEVASRITVEKLASVQKEIQNCNSLKEVIDCIQTAISEINRIVCNLSRNHRELKGMGATLVLLVICGNEYAVLNIGDSRAYHFKNGTLTQITKDHTEGQRMLDLGLLNRKEISAFPARKNLNRYVGYCQDSYVLQADEYYPELYGGMVLLCSDGITDFLSESRISEILNSATSLEIAGEQLVNEAVAPHNADNATAILIPL